MPNDTTPDVYDRVLMAIGGAVVPVSRADFQTNFIGGLTGTRPDKFDAVLMAIGGSVVPVLRDDFINKFIGGQSRTRPDRNDAVLMAIGGAASPVTLADFVAGGWSVSAIQQLFLDGANGAWFKSVGMATGQMLDSSGRRQDLLQSTAAAQPAVATAGNGLNESTFDGTADYLYQQLSASVTMASAITAPDAAGTDTGKGFTCTGICRDADDGTLWVANHGKAREPDPQFSAIVHLSADGSTVLAEYELIADLGIAGATSVQGICHNTTAGKIAFFHLGDNKIYEVNKNGTGCAAHANIAAITGGNGLAWDSALAQYVVGVSSSARWYNTATGALVKSRSMGVAADQLCYDADRNWLWFTYGTNGQPGKLEAIDLNTTKDDAPRPALLTLSHADSIEGCLVEGDDILIANDGWYHSGAALLNQFQSYEQAIPQHLHLNQRFQIAGVIRLPAAPSGSSRCLISFGPPLAAGADDGFAIYVPTGSLTSLRLFHRNGNKDITGLPNLSTTRVFFLDCDITNNLYSLWIDGTNYANGVAFTSGLAPSTQRKLAVLGARQNAGAPDSFLNMELGELVWAQGTTMLTARADVEAELTSRAY